MVEMDLSTKLCAKALSSKWLKLLEVSCCQKVIRPGIRHKAIFSPYKLLISSFFTNEKSLVKKLPSFTIGKGQKLHTLAAAHIGHKQRRWIFCTRSDFWWGKSHGGSLCKCMSMQVVDLSALAMLASITGFILRCFQLKESNSAVATGGWSWWETTHPTQHPVTLSHH